MLLQLGEMDDDQCMHLNFAGHVQAVREAGQQMSS